MWEFNSIVVGHYCELNSHMTGLIYVLLTNRRSKLRISLSIRLASEIIILLTMSALPVKCCRSMKLFILLISCSPASRYGFIIVCLIYLLPLAGGIELNPGPVASYLDNVHPVPKEPFQRQVYG